MVRSLKVPAGMTLNSVNAVAVDGGKDYLRRVGNKDDYEELIEYEGRDDDEE